MDRTWNGPGRTTGQIGALPPGEGNAPARDGRRKTGACVRTGRGSRTSRPARVYNRGARPGQCATLAPPAAPSAGPGHQELPPLRGHAAWYDDILSVPITT
jgi:hypothetical protein